LEKVKGSKHIIEVYDFNENGDCRWEKNILQPQQDYEELHYLPIELMAENLYDCMIRYPGGMPSGLASRLFIQLLQGVSALHEKNLSHNDLKPCAVLLSTQLQEGLDSLVQTTDTKFIRLPTVKLCDFGSCNSLERLKRVDDGNGTTPGHVPPEVALAHYKHQLDKRTKKVLLSAAIGVKSRGVIQSPPMRGQQQPNTLIVPLSLESNQSPSRLGGEAGQKSPGKSDGRNVWKKKESPVTSAEKKKRDSEASFEQSKKAVECAESVVNNWNADFRAAEALESAKMKCDEAKKVLLQAEENLESARYQSGTNDRLRASWISDEKYSPLFLDIWSLGLLLYYMLTGKELLADACDSDDSGEILKIYKQMSTEKGIEEVLGPAFEAERKGKLGASDPLFEKLLSGLLKFDATKRITLSTAISMTEEWIKRSPFPSASDPGGLWSEHETGYKLEVWGDACKNSVETLVKKHSGAGGGVKDPTGKFTMEGLPKSWAFFFSKEACLFVKNIIAASQQRPNPRVSHPKHPTGVLSCLFFDSFISEYQHFMAPQKHWSKFLSAVKGKDFVASAGTAPSVTTGGASSDTRGRGGGGGGGGGGERKNQRRRGGKQDKNIPPNSPQQNNRPRLLTTNLGTPSKISNVLGGGGLKTPSSVKSAGGPYTGKGSNNTIKDSFDSFEQ